MGEAHLKSGDPDEIERGAIPDGSTDGATE